MPEPKTADYWRNQGYTLAIGTATCPACQQSIQIWEKGKIFVPVDPKTSEPHWSVCAKAKVFRTEQQMKAGVL